MKKALLKIGHGLCFFPTLVFAAAALHFFPSDIGTFLGAILLGTGPALGIMALRNELEGRRSIKVLIYLGIWTVIIVLFCIIFI